MCTAISWTGSCHCFGRNLDLECSYGEAVAVTPRRCPLVFRNGETLHRHHAMIGMAHMARGTALYYEATNEHGLSAAALNFPHSAVYHPRSDTRVNIAPFELISCVLGRCACLDEARTLLGTLNLWQEDHSPALKATPLHWLVADQTGALAVESTADALHIHENTACVLTNEPPFPFHRAHRQLYRTLTPADPAVPGFSRGLGSAGLPGGLDSASRFVRAAFTAANALPGENELQDVTRFFRILATVAQTAGCLLLPDGSHQHTRYSCCCTQRGTYYYTTADNPSLTAVDLRREDLEGNTVVTYPLRSTPRVMWEKPLSRG